MVPGFRKSLLALTAVSAAALLGACSDSGNASKTTPTASAPAADKTTTASTQQTPATSTPAAQTQVAQAAAPAPAEPAKPAVAAPKSQGTVDVAKLMEPGALPDIVKGKADAPVTIVEYASMTCPHCAHFATATLPELEKKYIETGKAKLILREFPFDPRAEAGFMLARCSKDNYYPMVDVLFKQQNNWAAVDNAKDALFNLAKLAGFTQQSFEACLTDQKLLDNIRAVRDRGNKEFGVDSTPTFFINGEKYPGALSIDEMSAIIDPKL